MSTKVLCPVCGASFEIPEHQHEMSGVAIGKDSNLGNVYLKLEGRMNQLREHGIDTSKYFSVVAPSGRDVLMKWEGSSPVPVRSDDPILSSIMSSGMIDNRNLFRRWVMSQVFHGLSYNGGQQNGGFSAWMHAKGYEYVWKMTEEELRVQAKLEFRDAENFAERNRWFNREVAYGIAVDYVENLKRFVEKLPVKRQNGEEFKILKGVRIQNCRISDTIDGMYSNFLDAILNASDARSLYNAFHRFNVQRIKIKTEVKQPAIWCNAYKGAGAFFTMKNLILFHDCDVYENGESEHSSDRSMYIINQSAELYKNEGWRLLGFMKKLIRDNNIDIVAKMSEWRKK